MFSSAEQMWGTVAMARVWHPLYTPPKGKGFVPALTCIMLTVAPGGPCFCLLSFTTISE